MTDMDFKASVVSTCDKKFKMSLSLVIIIVGLACVPARTSMTYKHSIYVDPNNGTDPECVISNSSSISCNSLSLALNVSHRASSTQYILSNGTHYLDQSITTFEGLNMIAFSGRGNSYRDTVIYCTSNKAGLAFENITDIVFSNITFYNCSAIRNSTSKNFHQKNSKYTVYTFYVGLYFYSCRNVNMSFIKIDSSPSATGVVMYDTDGTNTVTNCVFSNNTVDPENRLFPGGGGFYVEFTYCIPGDIHCGNNQSTVKSHTSRNTNSHYTFDGCIFSENRANNSDSGSSNSTYIVPFRADHDAFGRGGGLSIFMKGDANNNMFTISDCHFIENSALWGAGLFVEFHDDTYENTVEVVDSWMRDNGCYFNLYSGTSGGGMRIGHYVYGNESETIPLDRSGNHVIVKRCHFNNNAALNGGGLSISPTVQYGGPDQVATIDIIESTFQNNTAKLGAAIHIDRFVMILDGHIINVNINSCEFDFNSVEYTEYIQNHFFHTYSAYQIGVGVVYVNQVPVSFNEMASFANNVGTAVAAVGSHLDFTNCNATFILNKGNNGGAIALLGAAYIVINDNTSMLFERNVATLHGGAVYNKYIEKENLISYTNCFIRHVNYFQRPENWKAQFIFISNSDQGGNQINAIHTTSVLPCSRAGGSGISKSKNSIFCWNLLWDYRHSNSCSDQITSDVGEIKFERDNTIDAFPGRQFAIPMTIKDDLVSDVSDETLFSARSSLNASLSKVSYVWRENATVHGKENENVSLQLNSMGDRIWRVNLVIELQPCPPGFRMEDNGTMCVCAGRYGRALDCDPQTFKAYLSEDIWMGRIPESDTYFVSFCPPNYCSSSPYTALPNTSIKLDEEICGVNNRQNIICGECLPGFGVAVNSPTHQCINCTAEDFGLNIVKYISAVYIPLTAIFTVIILFNIRLTSAPANAFILYSQVIASTFSLYADGQISVTRITHNNITASELTQAFKVVYGIFNLQFVERFIPSLCLGYLNTLDVFLLDYAVALFPLVMIILVLAAFKLKECIVAKCLIRRTRRGIRHVPQFSKAHAIRRKWNINEAILPAFAAFILLSYTKFTTTSSYMLLSQPLLDENGHSFGPYHAYYAGQYTTDNRNYKLKYILPACLVYGTFVAIPPILLLDFPRRLFEWCISRVDFLWRYYPADKVQIFLDTFQGCYKNKMRFFAGLYFIFRLIINTSYIGTHNWFDQFAVQQVACAVMVALLAICQPYNDENKIFNIVDILIFTNLGILNALSNYALSQSDPTQPQISKFTFALQYILVFVPLIYMLLYIVWWCLRPCRPRIHQWLSRLKARIVGKLKLRRDRSLDVLAGDDNAERTESMDESPNIQSEEEALLHRAQAQNRYIPYTSTIVGIEETEGESTVQRVSSNADSDVRSKQSAQTSNYGSNGSTLMSNSQTKNESDGRPSVE